MKCFHRRRCAVIVAICLFAANRGGAAKADDAAVLQRAAAYLDARQSEWSKFSEAHRGEGANQVQCVSCHTGVTFLLARPALRMAAGVKEPTDHERRIASHAALRSANDARLDSPAFGLLYDESEAKKKESRGTEAILNALILSLRDHHAGLAKPSSELKAALDQLWRRQHTEGPKSGAWDWMDYDLQPWEASNGTFFGASLAVMALLSAPRDLEEPQEPAKRKAAQRLSDYLRDNVAKQNLHHQAWLLLPLRPGSNLLTTSQRDEILQALLKKQKADGGWSLSDLGDFQRGDGTPLVTTSDGYATGLIIAALRGQGRKVDDPSVARGLAWIRANQRPAGDWPAHSLNQKRDETTHVGRFMSDAATGLCVLALVNPPE